MVDQMDSGSERKTIYDGNEMTEEQAGDMDLAQFLRENNAAGALKVMTTSGRGMIPVENSRVYVTKTLDGDRVVFGKSMTDQSGIADDMVLPAPPRTSSVTEGKGVPYAEYDVEVENTDYNSVYIKGVPVFEGIKSIQNINMTRKGI